MSGNITKLETYILELQLKVIERVPSHLTSFSSLIDYIVHGRRAVWVTAAPFGSFFHTVVINSTPLPPRSLPLTLIGVTSVRDSTRCKNKPNVSAAARAPPPQPAAHVMKSRKGLLVRRWPFYTFIVLLTFLPDRGGERRNEVPGHESRFFNRQLDDFYWSAHSGSAGVDLPTITRRLTFLFSQHVTAFRSFHSFCWSLNDITLATDI